MTTPDVNPETSYFVVQRGDIQFKCLGSELSDKLTYDDVLVVQRGDTPYKITVDTVGAITPVMPWDGHDGGIWHVKNATETVRLFNWNVDDTWGTFTAYNIDGTNERQISEIQAGEELVFISDPASWGFFKDNSDPNTANWDFGKFTDTSKATDFFGLIARCTNFNGELGGNWDTSNVIDMSYTFHEAESFNQDIGGWDTSSIGSGYGMEGTFDDAKAFNQDLSGWCVTNIASKPQYFYDGATSWTLPKPCWGHCPRGENGVVDPCPLVPWEKNNGGIWHIINGSTQDLQINGRFTAWDIDGENEREITSIKRDEELVFVSSPEPGGIFRLCGGFDFGPLTDTSKVTSMHALLRDTNRVGDRTNGWDTSNVTSMEIMFALSGNINLNTSNWDTSKVSNMNGMFSDSIQFSGDITQWDTSSVTDMDVMFTMATDFNQNISGWDTSKVTSMRGMFSWAYKFNQDLSKWCVTLINSEPQNFDIYAGDWTNSRWRPVWGTCSRKEIFTSHKGGVWHVKNTGTATLWPTYGPYQTYTVDVVPLGLKSEIKPGEEVVFTTPPDASHLFASYKMSQESGNPFQNEGEWDFGEHTDTSKVTNMKELFNTSDRFNGRLGGNWDVSNVTSMDRMFPSSFAFDVNNQQDLRGWNTSSVENMDYLFWVKPNFNQDISGWDTGNVKSMEHMFDGCYIFNQDISGWDTGNVINMEGMFEECYEFNQDISGWDVKNVELMGNMFWQAEKFNQDLLPWCVSKISYEPSSFSFRTFAWVKEKPCWGSCPRGENGRITPCPRDWDFAEGAVWHIKNASERIILPDHYESWDYQGNNYTGRGRIDPGDDIVFISEDPEEIGFFQNQPGTWDFGHYTDTSRITNLSYLLANSPNFNGELGGNWDTSKVESMNSMFKGASSFNKDLSQWCVSKIPNEPTNFASGATAWTMSKPVWGTCPP